MRQRNYIFLCEIQRKTQEALQIVPDNDFSVVAGNGPVYTGLSLLVADRPQTPVNPGALAPGFLSHLRSLLSPAGRGKIIIFPPAGDCDFFLFPLRPKYVWPGHPRPTPCPHPLRWPDILRS